MAGGNDLTYAAHGIGSRIAPAILVVDDDPALRMICAEILQTAGYAVMTARHGRDALAQLAARPADLVLMDVLMPELDGIAAYQAIRADARLAAIPVVLMSASTTIPGLDAALADGTPMVAKPFDMDRLLRTVEQVLDGATAALAMA